MNKKFDFNMNELAIIVVVALVTIAFIMSVSAQDDSGIQILYNETKPPEILNSTTYPHHDDSYCVEYKGWKVLVLYYKPNWCGETLDYYVLQGYQIKSATNSYVWLVK